MKNSLIPLFLLIATYMQAQAAKPRPNSWPQEPTSFLGITFGKPITSSIEECPWSEASGMKLYSADTIDQPCFEANGDFYEVKNTGIFFDVFVHEIDGKVEAVDGGFNVHAGDSVARALREKLGPPRVDSITHLRNGMGASFQGHRLIWFGKHLQVDFDSLASDVNQGSVAAFTPAYSAALNQEKKHQESAVKGVI